MTDLNMLLSCFNLERRYLFLTVERLGQLSEVDVLEPPAEAVRLLQDDDVAEPLYISPHGQTDQRMFSAR